jgi:hypothetical protein
LGGRPLHRRPPCIDARRAADGKRSGRARARGVYAHRSEPVKRPASRGRGALPSTMSARPNTFGWPQRRARPGGPCRLEMVGSADPLLGGRAIRGLTPRSGRSGRPFEHQASRAPLAGYRTVTRPTPPWRSRSRRFAAVA